VQALRVILGTLVVATAVTLSAQPAGQQVGDELQIDLATAIRLADERNLDVAIYLARIEAADARLTQARLTAVPSIRVGATEDRHDGPIQETGGNVLDVERISQFTGVTAGIGVDIADAIFLPLVARQNRAAVVAGSTVNRQQVLMQVAAAYVRLVQARTEVGVVERALLRATDLATLTADYAESGEGLPSDAEMAAVQPVLWAQRRAAAEERVAALNAELVKLLHLDSNVELAPVESEPPSVDIFTGAEDVAELVAGAQLGRPESEQADALLAAAEGDLSAQRYGWFVPSVSFSWSSGDFGGAPGSSVPSTDKRQDRSLTLYWQFEGLGFGQRARIEEKRAQLQELTLQRDKLRDAIAAEVRESHARVVSLKSQVELADTVVEHAQRAYELNRTRIFDQQGLPLEALAAMQQLANAELGALDARAGLAVAQLRLHTVLGNPLAGAL
jgi:outer membrane protein TolC